MDNLMNEILDEYRKEDNKSMGAIPVWMVDKLIAQLDFATSTEKILFRKMICRIVYEDRRKDELYREAIIQAVMTEHLKI